MPGDDAIGSKRPETALATFRRKVASLFTALQESHGVRRQPHIILLQAPPGDETPFVDFLAVRSDFSSAPAQTGSSDPGRS
jgi:hypothetical protein